MELLNKIQQELKAPKGQFNAFGKFNYRSCEDILEAVKPMLGEHTLTITDDMVQIGERYYVKATVTLTEKIGSQGSSHPVSVSAFAREPEVQKGMNESMITGSASSYARKYALNGLFCIDDAKDADNDDNDGTAGPPPPSKKAEKVLALICEKMIDSVPEGSVLVEPRVDAVLYAQQGRYPEDINKAGTVAAWLIGLLNDGDSWHTVTKKAGV